MEQYWPGGSCIKQLGTQQEQFKFLNHSKIKVNAYDLLNTGKESPTGSDSTSNHLQAEQSKSNVDGMDACYRLESSSTASGFSIFPLNRIPTSVSFTENCFLSIRVGSTQSMRGCCSERQ